MNPIMIYSTMHVYWFTYSELYIGSQLLHLVEDDSHLLPLKGIPCHPGGEWLPRRPVDDPPWYPLADDPLRPSAAAVVHLLGVLFNTNLFPQFHMF